MQSISLPQLELQKINRLVYKFLLQKRLSNRRAFEKIKRKVLVAEYSKGGFNIINVNEFQKSPIHPKGRKTV